MSKEKCLLLVNSDWVFMLEFDNSMKYHETVVDILFELEIHSINRISTTYGNLDTIGGDLDVTDVEGICKRYATLSGSAECTIDFRFYKDEDGVVNDPYISLRKVCDSILENKSCVYEDVMTLVFNELTNNRKTSSRYRDVREVV